MSEGGQDRRHHSGPAGDRTASRVQVVGVVGAAASCGVMLVGVIAGAVGVAGAGAAGGMAGMAQSSSSPQIVSILDHASLPLLLISVAVMVWGVWWGRNASAKILVLLGSAVLLINQWHMHWVLLIAGLLIVASAYAVLWRQARKLPVRP